MLSAIRPWLVLALLVVARTPAAAQQTPPPAQPAPAPAAVPAPRPAGVAATVNGQPISEESIQRALRRVPPEKQAQARTEVLDLFVDNLLLDQHLAQLNLAVEKKDIDARLLEIQAEMKKQGQTYEKVLKDLMLTEDELRTQVAAEMRWEKYADTQATDKALRDFFDGNKEMFDGSMVRVRHVLLTPAANDAQAGNNAKAQLLLYKKQIDDQVQSGLAKLPPTADALEREKARVKLTDEAFAKAASDHSACPSKTQGGDVGWFPRVGGMVEPFAKAAFTLKSYQMSDVVVTEFGHHLILLTDRKEGKEPKFEEAKEDIKAVYCERLREGLCQRLRPAAKIVINPAPKQ